MDVMTWCHDLLLRSLTLLHPVDETPEHTHLAPLGYGHVLLELQLGGGARNMGAGEGDRLGWNVAVIGIDSNTFTPTCSAMMGARAATIAGQRKLRQSLRLQRATSRQLEARGGPGHQSRWVHG